MRENEREIQRGVAGNSMRDCGLSTRDKELLLIVWKWRYISARHIMVLAKFPSLRTTDRRLKVLIENKLLERKKHLYGVPYLYTISHKGRMLIGVNKRADTVRLDRIKHDFLVLDTAIFLMKQQHIDIEHISTEKELHIQDGYSARRHRPDFLIKKDNQTIAVEIELSLKERTRLEKNIRENYLNYDSQIWVVNYEDLRVYRAVNSFKSEYTNMYLLNKKEVEEYSRKYTN